MDARERLRQFLEQRREMGESEFVLDNMSVEDAMSLLGAGRGASAARETDPRARRGAPEEDAIAARSPSSPDSPATEGASGDWRAALRALDEPRSREPSGTPRAANDAAARREHVRSDVERAPAPGSVARSVDARSGHADPGDVGRAPAESESDSPPSPHMLEEQGAAQEPGTTPEDSSSESRSSSRSDGEPVVPLSSIPTGLIIGSTAHELFSGPGSPFKSLDDVASAVATCTRCPLYKTAKNPVPGEGRADADLMCVGEAPGATEDETGRPFVGQAGALLTKILGAINLRREDVFIVNVLKHRPPGNRNPLPDEVAACSPYLVRQIELIRPKVIVAFGTFAAQTLLQTKEPLGKLRGKIHRYYGVPLIVTYHPAALLRNPSWKRPTWEDVKLARRLLDRALGA